MQSQTYKFMKMLQTIDKTRLKCFGHNQKSKHFSMSTKKWKSTKRNLMSRLAVGLVDVPQSC